MSLREIAVELDKPGYRNERGAVFSPASIASILARRQLITPKAQTFVHFIRYATKGPNIDTCFRTALPCCLAFRDSVRFVLVGIDARTDIRAAIGRTRR